MSPLAATNPTPAAQPPLSLRTREGARAAAPTAATAAGLPVEMHVGGTSPAIPQQATAKQLHPAELTFLCTAARCIRLRSR